VDLRVLDDSGEPIVGLTKADFTVTIDGKPAVIDAADWVAPDVNAPAQTQRAATELQPRSLSPHPVPAGRWIVLLYQKHSDLSDVEGMMRLRHDFATLASIVSEKDHVAVLSFDTSLHLWLDFTSDGRRIRRVLEHDIFVGSPPPIQPGPFPSLAASLPSDVATRTYTIEKSLQKVGDALTPLPGAKTIVVLGHGMGTWLPGLRMVQMPADYGDTVLALQRARVSVFSVDVTKADYHPREEGLRLIAADTGGFYMNTHIFTTAALNRVAGALVGYYVLFVVPPDAQQGNRRIEVSLPHRKGTILSRRAYLAQ
jgi:VWFA-related protein